MYAMAIRSINKGMTGRKYMRVGFTRVGACPICKKRVERSHTDIFFPYCGYSCKRVVDRKEEAKEKSKIRKQQILFESQYERERERRERAKARNEKEEVLNVIKSSLN